MIVADLHNKLSLSEYISEDFLTSSVFSAFRYLGVDALHKFLNLAVNSSGDLLNVENTAPVYEFWPWYSSDTKCGDGAEPDLVLRFKNMAIIVEAKNYAGKSGIGVNEYEVVDETGANETHFNLADQLAREYFIGTTRMLNPVSQSAINMDGIGDFSIVFVTRHILFPEKDIQDSIEAIDKINPSEGESARRRIYWVNWHKATKIFHEIANVSDEGFQNMIAAEMVEFLEKRELGVFQGFGFVGKARLNQQNGYAADLFYKEKKILYWPFLTQARSDRIAQSKSFYFTGENTAYFAFLGKNTCNAFTIQPFYKRQERTHGK
jgi:hypothetical protein